MVLNNENRTQIKKWVEVLKSGKYEQGKGTLEANGKFCCLGVACDLFIPKDKQMRGKKGHLVGMLPHDQDYAPDWLHSVNADIRVGYGTSLSTMNDRGESFIEIANIIEDMYLSQHLE